MGKTPSYSLLALSVTIHVSTFRDLFISIFIEMASYIRHLPTFVDKFLITNIDCVCVCALISLLNVPILSVFINQGGMSLRTRVERTVLEAKQVGTSRGGTRNVSKQSRKSQQKS